MCFLLFNFLVCCVLLVGNHSLILLFFFLNRGGYVLASMLEILAQIFIDVYVLYLYNIHSLFSGA